MQIFGSMQTIGSTQTFEPSEPRQHTLPLRFFGRARTTIRSRPAVLVGSTLARLGLIDGVAVWPDDARPIVALDLGDSTSSTWAQCLLPARARVTRDSVRTWQMLRARALLIPRGRSCLITAAETALERALVEPRVSLYSPGGSVGKLTFFIGESDREEPTAVVKAMGSATDGWWLEAEVRKLQMTRSLLPAEARESLFPPPLFAGTLDGEYLVVEGYESLVQNPADLRSPDRARAFRWLRAFQHSTTQGRPPWLETDTSRAVASVHDTWSLLSPDTAAAMEQSTRETFERLQGRPLPRCAAHGDFWPGNLGEVSGQLKVFDWEWLRFDETPCFDLWSYHICNLRFQALCGKLKGLSQRFNAAMAAVEEELVNAGADPDFALATLPTVLSELIIRVRRTLGRAGTWEESCEDLMAAVEEVVLRGRQDVYDEALRGVAA